MDVLKIKEEIRISGLLDSLSGFHLPDFTFQPGQPGFLLLSIVRLPLL